jgi:hypothetical protein
VVCVCKDLVHKQLDEKIACNTKTVNDHLGPDSPALTFLDTSTHDKVRPMTEALTFLVLTLTLRRFVLLRRTRWRPTPCERC